MIFCCWHSFENRYNSRIAPLQRLRFGVNNRFFSPKDRRTIVFGIRGRLLNMWAAAVPVCVRFAKNDRSSSSSGFCGSSVCRNLLECFLRSWKFITRLGVTGERLRLVLFWSAFATETWVFSPAPGAGPLPGGGWGALKWSYSSKGKAANSPFFASIWYLSANKKRHLAFYGYSGRLLRTRSFRERWCWKFQCIGICISVREISLIFGNFFHGLSGGPSRKCTLKRSAWSDHYRSGCRINLDFLNLAALNVRFSEN